MFEDLVRVLNQLALLSGHIVVFLCAHVSLYCGTFILERIVGRYRCFANIGGEVEIHFPGGEVDGCRIIARVCDSRV